MVIVQYVREKKTMIVSDHTIQAENLCDFFKNLGKKGFNVSKLAKIVKKNPGRALDITANVACAVVRRNPKAALSSLPEVVKFHHKGKGLDHGKIV